MATRKAIVMGIDNYPPPNYLPSCISDAGAFERLLRDGYGFSDVRSLLDGQATAANLEAAAGEMFAGAHPGDTLVIFYSGHGYSMADPSGTMQEYIVLLDSKGEPDFYSGHQLSQLSQSLPQGTLTVVLDSCFSGGMEKVFYALMRSDGLVERAKAKVWTPIKPERVDKGGLVRAYQPFGCAPVDLAAFPGPPESKIFQAQAMISQARQSALTLASLTAPTSRAPTGIQQLAKGFQVVLSKSETTARLQMNGLLIAACSENETAAASTSATKGLSAFTFCFLSELAAQAAAGRARPVVDTVVAVKGRLQALGFAQSPVDKANPTNLEDLVFLASSGPPAAAPAPVTSAPDLSALRDLLASRSRGALAPAPAPVPAAAGADMASPELIELLRTYLRSATSPGT